MIYLQGQYVQSWAHAEEMIRVLAEKVQPNVALEISRSALELSDDVFNEQNLESALVSNPVKLTAFWMRLVTKLSDGDPAKLGRNVGEALDRIGELDLTDAAQSELKSFLAGTTASSEEGLNLDLPRERVAVDFAPDNESALAIQLPWSPYIPRNTDEIGGRRIRTMSLEHGESRLDWTVKLALDRGPDTEDEPAQELALSLNDLSLGDLRVIDTALCQASGSFDAMMCSARDRSFDDIRGALISVRKVRDEKIDAVTEKLSGLAKIGWVDS